MFVDSWPKAGSIQGYSVLLWLELKVPKPVSSRAENKPWFGTFDVEELEWPARTPDLNPTEHLLSWTATPTAPQASSSDITAWPDWYSWSWMNTNPHSFLQE